MILICKKFLVLIKSAIGSSFINVLILLHDSGKCKHRTLLIYMAQRWHTLNLLMIGAAGGDTGGDLPVVIAGSAVALQSASLTSHAH